MAHVTLWDEWATSDIYTCCDKVLYLSLVLLTCVAVSEIKDEVLSKEWSVKLEKARGRNTYNICTYHRFACMLLYILL